MKVSDLGRVSPDRRNVAAAAGAQTETSGGFSFSRHMMDFSQAQYREYVENLKDRIFLQGETIKKKADVGEFVQYRRLIAELLEIVAGNAYACVKTSAFDKRGRRNVLVLIKAVNIKLDEMAQQILEEQRDNIRMLQMVDDIRGLLLDILL